MAYTNLNDLFKGICDAIRAKKGITGTINHQDIPSEIASIKINSGSGGFKYKEIQVACTDPINDVLTFTLDDFNPSQDYIKFIFGEISTEVSGLSGYFLNFHGSGDESNINHSSISGLPLNLDWVLSGNNSLYTGDKANEPMRIFDDGSGQFRINYSISSTIGCYFRNGTTYNLYVVYGH
jgi:hypothetical protein